MRRSVPPRRRPPRRQRPTKYRHWQAHRIGGEPWWRDVVRKLRVRRAPIESILEAATPDGDRTRIDPHELHAATIAERAVLYFALFPSVPTYATLMYVAHTWSRAGRSLHEWITQQYATLLEDESDVAREAARYSLWVDFFEEPTRAAFMFPRLWKKLGADGPRRELLASSGPVPWEVKEGIYRVAANEPALHDGLARGLAGSIYDYFGSIEPRAALAIWNRLTVDDKKVRDAFVHGLAPQAWRLEAVIIVDQTDERWRKWIQEARWLIPSFLVALTPLSPEPAPWIAGAELRAHGELIGRLAHRAFPFDDGIRHRLFGSVDPDRAVIFRVEGDDDAARRALGAEVAIAHELIV